MSTRKSPQLPPEPPPTVMEAIRKRFSGRELQALGVVFALRSTAQRVDNAVTGWMADTAASPARFQILMLLWAAKGSGVPHKAIVAAMGVTRATVSGLMAALEHDGLVKSSTDRDDRRNLLATLTSRGETIVGKAITNNTARLREAFASVSSDEMTTLVALLERLRQGFVASANAAKGQ